MSIRDALLEKFRLANLAATIIVLVGLFMTYEAGLKELFGAIIGAGLTWLFKTKTD